MSEMVQCMTCSRFALKGSPLARFGFGQCSKRKRGEFTSIVFPRLCEWHSEAKPADIEARR